VVEQALGRATPQADQPIPDWAHTLNCIITSGVALAKSINRSSEAISSDAALDANDPLPFEVLFLPSLYVARQKLAMRLSKFPHPEPIQFSPDYSSPEDTTPNLISSVARFGLERNLLYQLEHVAARTLLREFSLFRSAHGSFLDRLTTPSVRSESLYGAFIQEQLKDGLANIFQRYSVLGRLMARIVEMWVETTCEFLERVTQDRIVIATHFSSGVKLGKIVMLHAGLSDRHRNGRTVIAVGFEGGTKLIYKPKNMQLELAFNQFQIWCNRLDVPLPLRPFRVLDQGAYGWVEFIEPEPCQTKDEVRDFYTRAGMLQAILHILEGVDCHRENLIASGPHPVMIDMEALLTPQEPVPEDTPSINSAPYMLANVLNQSVIRCGLLPRWEQTIGGQNVIDLSGLSSAHDQTGEQPTPTWKHINTDAMTLVYKDHPLAPYPNVASLQYQPVALSDHLDDLLDGFSKMIHFFIRHRRTLLDSSSPLEALYRSPVRFIFRATSGYGTLLYNNLHPDCLENGLRWSTAFDALYRPFLDTDSKAKPEWFAPFLRAECEAIQNLDIPYFEAQADAVDILTPQGETISPCFQTSGRDRVRTRLQQLSTRDLEQQVQIIRYSLLARTVHEVRAAEDLSENQPTQRGHSLSTTRLLEAAQAIADELSEHVFPGTDGSVAWLGFDYYHEAGRYQLSPVWMTLYNGSSGIALFLAALARLTNKTKFAELSLAALKPLRVLLRQASEGRVRERIPTIGEAGGILYALVKVSMFLEQPQLLEDAHRLATLIRPDWISADKSYDVLLGSAGALLGLLALDATGTQRVRPDSALERARCCGQHLLKRQRAQEVGGAAWVNRNPSPLTGFSHGAAGIAYALQRLYSETHDADYLVAAQQAILYEQNVFNRDLGNWPDFRTIPLGFRRSWCHGGPGIGLARLGGLEVLDEPSFRHDIEAALQTTLTTKIGEGSVDHVCCGGFGLVDILLSASEILDRPDLRMAAHDRTNKMLKAAKRRGGFCLFPQVPYQVFQPAFYQGSTGIGYSLLRLVDSDLPSVLLWQ
jgi:type 2 lantibiotic biosynthesis protein LanM